LASVFGSPIQRAALTLGLVAVCAGTTGLTQGRVERRGGPRDWSHGRVVATRFGPDLDANVARDWRTFRKHAILERARAARDERGNDWREVLRDILQGRKKQDGDAAGSKLDWNLKTGGFGSVVGYPAKYSFDITASNCSDVVYFTVDQPGAATTVNLIGITNPYAGCSGNPAGQTPTVKFGIRLGTGTATSVVPSLDGKILYVIESRPSASGGVILHAILVDNIVSGPGTYNFATGAWQTTHTLAAPTGLATSEQLFQITFAGVTNNVASPYLDYDTNQIFFGDSAGRIHRVTSVNTTAAARDLTNFNFQCGTSQLQSPVFVNGQVIVTSANGRLYRINTSGGTPYSCISAQLGGSGANVGGGLSAPVVDVSNDKIIVTTNDADGYGLRGIGIFNLMFTAGEAPVSIAALGAGSTTIAPVAPAFDDAFWSTNVGNLYAAGAPDSGSGTYLIRLPYNGTTVGAATGFATLARSGGAQSVATSPVTEFLTASTNANPDFVFIGGGSGNYRFMNRIASGFGGTVTSPVAVANSFAAVGSGGITSGIVIDTRTTAVTGTTATANIYFGTVGVAGTQSLIIQLAQQF
jgi:hypothetical protein